MNHARGFLSFVSSALQRLLRSLQPLSVMPPARPALSLVPVRIRADRPVAHPRRHPIRPWR